ncbi:MAG: L,D-transpeptidase [Gemmatimonadota bacterium]
MHGTNVPSSIGQAVSYGCIRLRNSDIQALTPLVPVGTPVYIS